jgi:hypothetical protein
MDAPPLTAAVQVGFGGQLVFVTGLLIGRREGIPGPARRKDLGTRS